MFLHHPLYTSGRYRNDVARPSLGARADSEASRRQAWCSRGTSTSTSAPTLQNGIQYFVSGGAGSLRRGDGVPAPFIARTYDEDYHFMLVEIEDDELHFQAISRSGATIDAGDRCIEDMRRRRPASACRARRPVADRPAPWL